MIVSLLVRLGIVAGTVYATKSMGIWGSSKHSEMLMVSAKKEISPYAKDLKLKFCKWRFKDCKGPVLLEKPWRETWKDAWNETVKKGFYGLGVDAPYYYEKFNKDFAEGISTMLKPKEEVPPPKGKKVKKPKEEGKKH
ncbi:hypothetical protein KR018_005909 [Drosophila ironensis]|nr:hypothetical protein KR018_005909 [Drosophila ironensis]